MIALDTNVISELVKQVPDERVVHWVDQWDSAELVITAITAAELRAAVAFLPRGRRKTSVGERIEVLLTDTFAGYVVPFDVDSANHYADVLAARRRAGRPISALDAQIAAICRQYQATLATRNVGDFTRTGITVVDPWRS